ncbi:hypothetical protein B566_EDAN014840, partial [Ephemera danica]
MMSGKLKSTQKEDSGRVVQHNISKQRKKQKSPYSRRPNQVCSTSHFEVIDIEDPASSSSPMQTSPVCEEFEIPENTSSKVEPGIASSGSPHKGMTQKSDSEAEDLTTDFETILLDSDVDASSPKSVDIDSDDNIVETLTSMTDDVGENACSDVNIDVNKPPEDQRKQDSVSVTFEQETYKEFLVHFKPHAKLYFHGKLFVEIVDGCISVLGWKMHAGDSGTPVFSPRGSSLISLDAGPEPCCVKLKPYDCHLASCLQSLVPISLFTGSSEAHLPTPHVKRQAERSLDCRLVIDTQPYDTKRIQQGPEWERLLDDMTHACKQHCNSRMVLCGGKGVGKSTLLRVLVNSLLQSRQEDPKVSSESKGVVVVDFDPGQSEFTAPGILSVVFVKTPLLGPGYTHKQAPDKMVYLGQVDVSRCAEDYRQAVTDLIWFCKKNHSTVPWVINTMGFTTGLGVVLMEHILEVLETETCILEIRSRNLSRNYPLDLWRRAHHIRHYPIYSMAEHSVDGENLTSQWGLPPWQMREISLLSYLTPALHQTDFSLVTSMPCVIQMDKLIIGVLHERVHPDHVMRSIVGSLVGLCWAGPNARRNCLKPFGRPGPLVFTRPYALPCFGY